MVFELVGKVNGAWDSRWCLNDIGNWYWVIKTYKWYRIVNGADLKIVNSHGDNKWCWIIRTDKQCWG